MRRLALLIGPRLAEERAVVATAGGLSRDGRRRRSPLATAASHEWRRGTLHKHWACLVGPHGWEQRPPWEDKRRPLR